MLTALLAAVLLFSAVPAAYALEEGGEGTQETETTETQTQSSQPALDLSAKSALLMERETGKILYEDNAHTPMEPASVTKVMTMLLIFEAVESGQLGWDDMITVSANAMNMGGSQVYLEEGEQFSLHEMLKAISVVSANDACVAVAEHLYGSELAFVEKMNQRAAELGMEHTVFLNCTGLPASGHLTTAYDIALMSQELLKHEKIHEFSTIWMDTFRDGSFGLSNTNKLIHSYEGATGLKTGYTDNAKYCISATAERDGMELIAVVMGAPTSDERFADAKAMLNYGFSNYALVNVYPDEPLPPISVSLGVCETVQPILPEGSSCLLLEKSKQSQLETSITLCEEISAPVAAGDKLGEMTITLGGEPYASIPIVAADSVERLSGFGIWKLMLKQLLMAG